MAKERTAQTMYRGDIPSSRSENRLDEPVQKYNNLVRRIAFNIAKRLPPNVAPEDLIQAGMIGLLESVDRYDASQGASFQTYAGIRITGAILDELRRGDWTPRSVYNTRRKIDQVLSRQEQREGKPQRPTPEMAEEINLPFDRLLKLMTDYNNSSPSQLDPMLDEDDQDVVQPPASKSLSPEDELQQYMIWNEVERFISTLPPKRQRFFHLTVQGKRLREIGAEMGFSESRACQIRNEMVGEIREHFIACGST